MTAQTARNGNSGGTFKLPVVVHGEWAWCDIKDHAALAQELKARVHMIGGNKIMDTHVHNSSTYTHSAAP